MTQVIECLPGKHEALNSNVYFKKTNSNKHCYASSCMSFDKDFKILEF
jgi:hypothetical protein